MADMGPGEDRTIVAHGRSDGSSSTADAGRYTVTVVDRTLSVLEALADRPDIGVTDLANRLGLTKSLVFRLLYTLEARGFVAKDPERSTYTLGYRLLYLGARTEQQKRLLAVANPVLDDLCRAADENVNLLVREGLSCLCAATRESSHPVRLFAQVGRRGPLHAGGASMVLLAYAPEAVRKAVLAGPLPAFTDHTVTDPTLLSAVLDRIRGTGIHVTRDDLDLGAFSIAAPIRDASRQVVAAVSVAGPTGRLSEDHQARHVELVTDAAREIANRLAGS